MEEELKCPVCRRLFVNPVQLPVCWHHLCYSCAAARLQPASSVSMLQSMTSLSSAGYGITGSRSRLATSVSCQRVDTTSGFESGVTVVAGGMIVKSPSSGSNGNGSDASSDRDSDVASVVSETDSGVVVVGVGGAIALTGSGIRSGDTQSPCISASMSSLSLQSDTGSVTSSSSSPAASYVISCPTCSRLVPVDSGGVKSLARPRALEVIVDRYREARGLPIICQLCAPGQGQGQDQGPNGATRFCEQCELYLCDSCVHAEHKTTAGNLVEMRRLMDTCLREADSRCVEHQDELRSLYCLICRATICSICQQQGRHFGHQAQPMGAMSRAQKVTITIFRCYIETDIRMH